MDDDDEEAGLLGGAGAGGGSNKARIREYVTDELRHFEPLVLHVPD